MKISSMRLLLALLCVVLMVSRGVSFHGSLPIRPIIQRSRFLFYLFHTMTYISIRVILCSIKSLSEYLCPLCTCEKEKVRDLGTKADNSRRSAIRVYSEERQNKVEKAREWIFQKGRAVTSEGIDNYFGLSMVPIRVRSLPF